MGAENFMTRAKGKTPNEAFGRAVDEARYEYGHRGYTGTIAEKSSFKLVPVPAGRDPKDFACECSDDSEGKFWDDKYGPAACVQLTTTPDEKGEHTYVFFGWASS